ncbi:MAG TPA: benzoate-CoA ligase family protein [Ktedonobacter sp.]|jgi:benzoate-CoA ligase|nr:benzoate-CoA ligase family protein [Ktedonobacter sp.]HAT45415.1 benzoate-CoA ligase family protein [Ktedonobacter sp.]HBE25145.1 benzoate-CoA ligase family protein [Ktedonobacter sp.]HCF87991.1 benzoate-CoA ligase family protein [Ktedonobacter sp.]HCJ34448.1 benzoate-CoA ligase family protein [Ktedonobacter sp.]
MATLPTSSTFPSIVIPDQFNAATAFLDRQLTEGKGAKAAIFYEGTSYTYAQIAELSNRVGNGLLDLGIEMEQRVALLLLDSPQFAAAFFGAIKIGAVAVPMNTMLRPKDYVYMLNDSRARVLFIHTAIWQQIEPILSELKYLRHLIVVETPSTSSASVSANATTPTLHDFEQWVNRASSSLETAQTSKDDSAFWLYSSGSTGFPKGCVHLQHDMTYCTEYYAKSVLGITENDITFSAAKLFFAYGLGNNLYFPFGVGASAVHFPGRPLPEDMFKVVEQYRPTIFFGVPTLYAGMLALPNAGKRFDFSSVRVCISAGEALPADILRRFEDTFHVEILDGIGSTEILHIFISNRAGEIKPGSTGKLVPGYEALVADENGVAVAQGDIGNLLIKGESTTAYYWNKHEKTKDVIQGHWIHTGDKYYQDEEGYYWYCGRSDDMLKVGGQWVSPVEVENALIAHPAVLETAIVGEFDADELVKPKAYVVLREGQEPSEALAEELKAFVKQRLAPFKYPRWIEFLPELPKTATGKIQRFILRGTGRTEPLDPSTIL